MKTKAELRQAHGTPAEFAKALRKAITQGMITLAEAQAAMKKYESEYANAPEK